MIMKRKSGDPMGAAIQDYHKYGKADTLIVRSSMFDDDEIPVKDLFREYSLDELLSSIISFNSAIVFFLDFSLSPIATVK